MAVVLVLLLNAILQIRPAEFVPGLLTVPIYEITLALCLIVCGPRLLAEATPRVLAATPILKCLLWFSLFSLASNLAQGDLELLAETGTDLVRIVLYVGLVIAVIDTPVRLRWFLASCALCAAIVTGLAILNYQGIVTISGYHIVEADVRRLGASGLYGDPNDLALLITQGLILAAYGLTSRRWSMPIRLVHLAWIAVLGLGLQLTYSRGGLMALLAGVATAVLTRYRAKGLMIAGLTLPLVLTVFAGRQADFSGAIGSGSGQSRIHLWDHYLSLVADNPGLGIGAGGWKYHARQVAHNSFLHAFAETGLPGGVAFLALFVVAAQTLSDLGPRSRQILDPEMARLRPYLLAMLSSYVVGMLSLTRVFTLPTYTMLACIAAYARLTPAEPPCQPPRLNPTFWCKATAAGFLFLVLTWIYVKRSASYY